MGNKLAKRALGASGLQVSPIGFGLMSLSGIYGASDDENGTKLIQQAIDQGVDFLDSSDMYGWGHNETLLSKALPGYRDRVVLASKFGQVRREDGTQGVDGRPEYVRAACEASLQRLADRRDRSLLRAPHRSQRRYRGDGWCDGRLGQSGESPCAWTV